MSSTGPNFRQPSGSLLRAERKDSFIAGIAAIAILFHLVLRHLFHSGPVYLLPLYIALVAGGVPLLVQLLRQVAKGQFGADLLAGFSIVTGVLLHEYLVACIVVLMLSGGSALEQYATRRASSALRALAKRMPTTARLVTPSGFVSVEAQGVVPGNVVVVLPHEISPVDGEVVEGHGEMDESYLTGEPFNIRKAPGSQVLSGAVNGSSALKVKATKLPLDSRYARILRVVEEAEKNRPAMRRVADRLGAWYTPLALLIALLGWFLGGSAERFLAVIVIATPCPLLIAIPVAIIGGISLAARRGIVIKHAAILETIDTCSIFFFDKTGTLTYGRPLLSDILCAPGFTETNILFYSSGLEQYSRHPLAKAVMNAALGRQIKPPVPSGVAERPGQGLRGMIDGHQVRITGRNSLSPLASSQLPPVAIGLECVVLIDESLAALLRFHDEPRQDSGSFIRHLGSRHKAQEVVLLSGDRQMEVEHMARTVGIERIYAGKSPEEKQDLVRVASARARTLFVGDGINDAPAMLAATASVALGGQSSDVVSEAADAVVLDSSLRRVDELMHIARRTHSIALQSAVGGMLLSVLGMGFAACGFLPPLVGAVSQEIIDLAAVLNALRVTLPAAHMSDF
ncbi:MAG TPA: heavy metal translocating P-type ATPase [Candidatus Angelobacter sp.]|nr:heavy metal translocating P-type ATPase [Candidatus Angelobacter sp.]